MRLAEIVGALSIATDLGMGLRPQSALSVCVLAHRLADRLGLPTDVRVRVYYLALLRNIGCTAGAQDFAALVGDEIEFRRAVAPLDLSSRRGLLSYLRRHAVGQSAGVSGRLATLFRLATHPNLLNEASAAVCEVAQRFAARLGFGERLQDDLLLLYERYDGRGVPAGLPGAEVTWPARVVQVAEAAVLHDELGGIAAAVEMLRARSGAAYHPDVVDAFCADAADLLTGVRDDGGWQLALDAEPGERPVLSGPTLDDALRTMGDFADLTSPYMVGHSAGVADLAAAAARAAGLPAHDVTLLRRAGWLHDLGRVAISAQIWGSPRALTRGQRARVRLHPQYTGRILAPSPALRPVAALAVTHHERMDGSGYHRGGTAADLSPAARLLAAADVYRALTEQRPYRPAYSADDAGKELLEQAHTGQLDGDAAAAVLTAVGRRVPRRRNGVAGLTSREIEVLRLLARGRSTKEIAVQLLVSQRSVEHHIERIYAKAGVRTRAAAAAFALQQQLMEPAG